VLEAGPLLQVADGQLDGGVGPVEGVDLDGRPVQVGQEGEVTPLRPQRGLASDQSGAAHDETAALVDALGHLGLAVAPCSRSGSRPTRRWPTALVTALIMRTPMV
jgi:hypothetical protein